MKKGLFVFLFIAFLSSYKINLSPHKASFPPENQPRPSPISADNKVEADQVDLKLKNARVLNMLSNLPLYFIENKGQMDNKVIYYTKTRTGAVYFAPEEVIYQFIRNKDDEKSRKERINKQGRAKREEVSVENIRIRYVGANSEKKIEGLEESEAKFSYFQGNDPENWVNRASSYHKLIYRELYSGIDLIVSGKEGRIKNEYVVKAGAEVGKIGLKVEGAKAIRINKKGQLEIDLKKGFLLENVPVSYQVIGEKRVEVKTWYWQDKDNVIRLEAGEYRKDKELIIDPLVYSTYLGTSNLDSGSAVAIDESGNAYLTGYTISTNFPVTSGAFDTSHNGAFDTFITKLNSTGTSLVFSTYLGGSNNDGGQEGMAGIAIDDSKNVYVTGYTYSTNFPTTTGAYDRTHNGSYDVFITKLNSAGSGLVFSTYLGGNSGDGGMEIILAGSCIYVAGITLSTNFPTTPGAYDTSFNSGYDVFLTVMNSSGTGLYYSTYLGGSGDDFCGGFALDLTGNAYVTGVTSSSNFPTTSGAYDTSYNGGEDVFVTKIFLITSFLIPFGSLDNGNVNMGNTGNSTANVNLKILDTGGGILGQDNFTIPGKGIIRSWDRIGNIYAYGKPVTVEIIGNQQLVGDNIKWANAPYDTVGAGFTCGSLGFMKGKQFFFPFSSFGGWANAYCVIANTADSTTDIGIHVFNSAGIQKKTVYSTIGARGVVRSWDIIGSIQAIADPALVYIFTDKDVVVEAVRWEQNTRGWGFALFPATPFPSAPGASLQFIIPFGSLDNGNVNIGNISSVYTANVTLRVVNNSGSVVKTESFTIPSFGVVRSWDKIGNIYSYGKPVTVEITSSNCPIVGDNIKWANSPYETVGAGFSCGSVGFMKGKEFYFPFSSFGGWANAYCVMSNTTSSTANVTINVYNSGGTLMATVNFSIGGNGVARSWEYLGSIQAIAEPALLKITSNQDLVVEAVRWEQNKRGWGFAILPVK